MKRIRIFIILAICLFNSLLSATILKDFYHDNHGPVERVVFVFSENPRYRIREDAISVNITFFETTLAPNLKTEDIHDNPIISRIALVPTDHFLGTLINTYQEYRIDSFVLQSGDDYKFVVDVFKKKIPRSSTIASEYAAFYRKMGNTKKAVYYEMMADSLANAGKIIEPPPEPEPVIDKPVIHIQESLEEEEQEPLKKEPVSDTEIIEKIVKQKTSHEPAPKKKPKKSYQKSFKDRIPEIIKDIYHDKMLMFSIIVVVGVILIMLIMSLIRKLHKPAKKEKEETSDSYGSQEFQRVTIKRLLANGWQIEEIAKELNITPDQVEELGRDRS